MVARRRLQILACPYTSGCDRLSRLAANIVLLLHICDVTDPSELRSLHIVIQAQLFADDHFALDVANHKNRNSRHQKDCVKQPREYPEIRQCL